MSAPYLYPQQQPSFAGMSEEESLVVATLYAAAMDSAKEYITHKNLVKTLELCNTQIQAAKNLREYNSQALKEKYSKQQVFQYQQPPFSEQQHAQYPQQRYPGSSPTMGEVLKSFKPGN